MEAALEVNGEEGKEGGRARAAAAAYERKLVEEIGEVRF